MTDQTPADEFDPDSFDFDAWLENGTTTTIDVTINNNFNRALLERYDALENAAAAAEAALAAAHAPADDDVDEALEADVDVSALEATLDAALDDLERLYLRFKDTEMTVTVRALDPTETEDIALKHYIPTAPERVGKGATREEQRKFDRDAARWRKEATAAELARDLAQVELAIVKVVDGHGKPGPKLRADALRRLYQRPHGPTMFRKIHAAVLAATKTDAQVNAPKSREPFTSTKD